MSRLFVLCLAIVLCAVDVGAVNAKCSSISGVVADIASGSYSNCSSTSTSIPTVSETENQCMLLLDRLTCIASQLDSVNTQECARALLGDLQKIQTAFDAVLRAVDIGVCTFNCFVCKKNGGTCPTSLQCVCPDGRVGENCEYAGCRLLNTNAVIHNKQSIYTVGYEIHLGCDTGTLSGSPTLVCLESGHWSGEAYCVEEKETTYRLRVTTGNEIWEKSDQAGTNGNVFVKIYGISGLYTEEEWLLTDMDGEQHNFLPGTVDAFEIKSRELETISRIDIRLETEKDGSWVFDPWYLESMSIYYSSRNLFYGFPVGRWIHDDNTIYTFKPNGGDENRQCGDTFSIDQTMIVTDMTYLGNGRDEISCKMMCIEADFACYAIVFKIDFGKNCYGLNEDQFHAMKPSTDGSGLNVSTRNYCGTKGN